MNKRPNFKKLAYMLGVYSNRTIPQTYIMEMSNYELLLAILDKVNEIIERCATYDDVMNEIINYLNTLDDEVIAEVSRILNEWFDSGKFDESLQSVADKWFEDYLNDWMNHVNLSLQEMNETISDNKEYLEKNAKNSTLDFERVFRVLKQTNNYLYSQPDLTNPADDQRTPRYTFAQGGCRYYKNGSGYNVNIYIANDGNQFDGNNKGLIEVRNSNGTSIIASKTFETTEIGHGQCICYNNNKFYFAGKLDGNPSPDPDYVHKVRWINDDLSGSVYGTILTNFLYINGIASYNNEVYVSQGLSREISVAKLQFEEDGVTVKPEVTNILTMSPMNLPSSHGENRNTYFSGGFSVTKDFYYFGTHQPEGILKCKRNYDSEGNEIAFTPYWWYEIPDKLNAREVKTGELEALTVFDNGNCFIYTSQHLNTKAVVCHDIMQVFVQNLKTNTRLPKVTRSAFTGRCNIFVANSSATTYPKKENGVTTIEPIVRTNNPFGTSFDGDPFETIDEAIWWFNNSEQYNYGYFHMQGDMPHVMFCCNGKNYYFNGTENINSTTHGGDRYTSCGNLLQYGGNVTLASCVCHSTIHYWANGSDYMGIKQHPIYCVDGVITMANSGAGWGNNPNIKGAMYLNHMVGNYNWSQTYDFVNQSGFVSANPNKYWCDPRTSTINWHNDASKSGNGTQTIEGNNSLYIND